MPEVSWEPPDPSRQWQLSMWTPRRPVPVLEREILVRFTAGQKRCLEEAGSGFRSDAVCFVNGYCYMAPSQLSEEDIAERRRAHEEHCRALEARGTDIYEGEVRPLLETRLKAVRSARRRAKTRAALVDALDLAMDAATDAMGNYHWRMWPPRAAEWKTEYAEITGRPEAEAGVLLQGVGHATATLVARMRKLARQIDGDPGAFDISFARLLRDYGRRTGYGLGSNVDFHTPTWTMRPEMVRELIAGYARSDLDAVEAAERRAKRQRTSLATRVRASLAGDPERLARFDAAYARAVEDVRRGEGSNYLIEQETMGSMREAIDSVGRYFCDRGALDEHDDAFHLSLDELRSAPEDELRRMVAARKAEVEARAALEPPAALGAEAVAVDPLLQSLTVQPSEPADEDDGVLRGVGVSPGTAKGRARISASTAEPPDVDPGDVLVASDAGPAWTPVFPIVAAIVLDGGHLNDHAAIMARDLGIPAVMRTTHATRRIPEGAAVVVDGDAGTVTCR